MFNVILPLLLALLGGVGGFFLRRWELATVFEETGLAVLWSAPSLVLIALSVVLAAAFVLLIRKPIHSLTDYSEAFSAKGSWPYLALMALAAAMLLFSGVLGLRAGLYAYCGLLCKLMNLMCIVSFLCVLAASLRSFRGKTFRYSLVLLAPGYTLCLWLVFSYQQRAADPVVLDYMYELLAIICTLIGLYFTAGFSFGRPKFRGCALFSLLGLYFSMVTLADAHALSDKLLFLFAVLYQLANLSVLLYHGFIAYTPTPSLPDETNHTQEVSPDE